MQNRNRRSHTSVIIKDKNDQRLISFGMKSLSSRNYPNNLLS